MSDSPELGRLARTVIAAATVTSLLLPAWYMIPEQERLWLRLRLAGRLRHGLARAASSEGRRGMRRELAGRDASPWYDAAYLLSRARDLLDKTLEGMRP